MSVTTTNATNPKPALAKEETRQYKLNTAHRCDRCGAQAYVHVVLNEDSNAPGLDLMFCKHHHTKFEHALLPIVDHDATNDESDRLYDVNRLVGTENN